jgi:DNA polymerase
MASDRTRAARDLLAFYVESGATELIGETPVDRLADPVPIVELAIAPAAVADPVPPQPIARRAPAPAASKAPASAPLSPDAAVMAAREAARTAQTLDELRALLEQFDGCALKTMAKRMVFADGNPQARLMLVGEAPGREEDIEGLPFVGPSGKLLDRMLAAIGLDRTQAYIANIIPWRPPGNRDPTPQESTICLPFIKRQIELVDPDVLVCLGRPSAAALLGLNEGIKRARGRWMTFNTGRREIRAVATFHPAFLLRSPLEKRHAWRDFLAIKKALAG